MNFVTTARTYWRYAAELGKYWERPIATTAAKLIASRVLYGRGPAEFDAFQFMDKPLRDWSGYLPDRELLRLEESTAPVRYRHLDEDKLAFARHCDESGLRTVPIVAVIARASAASDAACGVRVATSGGELAQVLRTEGDFDGFAKPRGAGQGYGAFGFTVRADSVVTRAGTGTFDDLFAQCRASMFARDGCYLLQRRIVPHAALAGVLPGPGLGTVRVLTFLRRNGEVLMPWAALKVPAPGAECDNLRFGSLLSAVVPETGELRAAVGKTSQRPIVHEVEKHPTTGVRFADVRLPHWPEVVDLVTRAARAFDKLPVLGWDVALTPDGPLLVEANWMFAIALPEIALGRGLAEEMRVLWAPPANGPA
jgi:hypothetical protein